MELSLNRIAAQLEGLEETIIHKLLDRAQFLSNDVVYRVGESGFEGEPHQSLFTLRLRYQEEMDAVFGRFCVPEERPYTQGLPPPRRQVRLPPTGLCIDDFQSVSVTSSIREAYMDLLPRLCRPGDDGHYGSSVEHDVYALQALARRIHFGALYVAECKYREEPDEYRPLIDRGDHEALLARLTRAEVEARIIARVGEKVSHLQARINPEVRVRIDPATVTDFYREHIIPLTKTSEVRYLLQRAEPGPDSGCARTPRNESL